MGSLRLQRGCGRMLCNGQNSRKFAVRDCKVQKPVPISVVKNRTVLRGLGSAGDSAAIVRFGTWKRPSESQPCIRLVCRKAAGNLVPDSIGIVGTAAGLPPTSQKLVQQFGTVFDWCFRLGAGELAPDIRPRIS
jgi:hypothetical protein